MPLFGTTPIIVYFPYSEQKMSTWLNKTGNITSLVEKTLHPGLCLKSRINQQKFCGKPTPIHPTNLDSLYLAPLSEGFDVAARNLGRERNGATKILHCLGPREENDFGQLYAHNPQLEGTQLKQEEKPDGYLHMD